nr:hypothetical protein [Mesorhizobium sp. B1-1-7]
MAELFQRHAQFLDELACFSSAENSVFTCASLISGLASICGTSRPIWSPVAVCSFKIATQSVNRKISICPDKSLLLPRQKLLFALAKVSFCSGKNSFLPWQKSPFAEGSMRSLDRHGQPEHTLTEACASPLRR